MKYILFLLVAFILFSCTRKYNYINPAIESIDFSKRKVHILRDDNFFADSLFYYSFQRVYELSSYEESVEDFPNVFWDEQQNQLKKIIDPKKLSIGDIILRNELETSQYFWFERKTPNKNTGDSLKIKVPKQIAYSNLNIEPDIVIVFGTMAFARYISRDASINNLQILNQYVIWDYKNNEAIGWGEVKDLSTFVRFYSKKTVWQNFIKLPMNLIFENTSWAID